LSSNWVSEALAVLRKEVLTELRGKHGLYSTLLFSVLTVAAIGIAAARTSPSPTLASAMLWVALLFAAITGLARTFIVEEEQGTGDLLRLVAEPGPVYFGKLLFNFLLLLLVSAILVPLFVLFVGVGIALPGLFLVGLSCGCACLSASISICGALVSRASGRAALAGVISIPVLLPAVMLGVGVTRIAFGDPGSSGTMSAVGLAGLAVAFCSVGPYLYAAVWKQ